MSNLSFNSRGELNASTVKEALASVVKIASLLDDNVPSNAGLTGQMSDDRRDALISRAISTQEGKLVLAQAMANPIK